MSLPENSGIENGIYTVYGRGAFAELVNEKKQAVAKGRLMFTFKPPVAEFIDCHGGIAPASLLSGWVAQLCCEWEIEGDSFESSGEFCFHLHIPNPFE